MIYTCNNCPYLNLTEEEQNKWYKQTGEKRFHICEKFHKRLYHFSTRGNLHPNLECCNECKTILIKNVNIYTTYFANLKNLPDTIIPVSICGKAPDGYTGLQYKKLAPKWEFFKVWKETRDNDYYIKNFKELVLDKLNITAAIEDLIELTGSSSIALVCYEKPEDFCHRHLVANWLIENGLRCTEFGSVNTSIIKNKLI